MDELKIILASQKQLKEVTVVSKQRTTYLNNFSPIRTLTMTGAELLKAACFRNLSESFETNPSVDVSYNDAVTGSKQIQLLGLSGNYTQLTVENLPCTKGNCNATGFKFHSRAMDRVYTINKRCRISCQRLRKYCRPDKCRIEETREQ